MIRTVIAALTILLVAPAAAQTPITPDEFLDIAEGRTLTFSNFPDGRLVGIEQFLSREESVWARADGSCVTGTITVEGPQLCFVYPDDPRKHCWWPFLDGDTLLVRFAEISSGSIQQVTQITKEPITCEDPGMV